MLAAGEDSFAEDTTISWRKPCGRSGRLRVQLRGPTVALLVAIAPFALPGVAPAHAQEKTAIDPEEAAKARLRPICADPAARAKTIAQMIAQGGEYERETAKWDLDATCEQIDLPVKPVHDTADFVDEASHTNWIYDARWSPDGKLIATAGRDGTVRLWDVATGKPVRKIDVTKMPSMKTGITTLLPGTMADSPVYVRAVRFLGDGRSLVVAADTHPVRIFDVAKGEAVAEVPYTQSDPTTRMPPVIAATATGLVVLWGSGGDLVVYDAKTTAERYRLQIPHDNPSLAVSEAAGFLATTSPGKEGRDRTVIVQLRKLATGEPLWQVEAEGDRSAYSMTFSRDGKQLAVAVHGQVYVYATADKKLIKKVVVYPTFGDFDIAFTADGMKLISTAKRHAQLWDIGTGKRVRHFGSFSDVCHSADVSPDGRYLVTSHMGSDGRIWEIETGTFYRRLGKNVRPRG